MISQRIKKGLRVCVLLLLSAIILVLLSVITVTSTQSGSRWITQQIIARLPFEVSVASIEGTWLSGLELARVEITQPEFHLSLARFSGKWDLLSLMRGRVQIDSLALERLQLQLTGEAEEPPGEPGPWPSVLLPVPVSIDRVTLSDLRVEDLRVANSNTQESATDEATQIIESLSFGLTIGALSSRLDKLRLVYSNYQVELDGSVGNTPPYQLDVRLAWQAELSQSLAGMARLKGNLKELQVTHELEQPYLLSSEGRVNTGFQAERMELKPLDFVFDLSNRWPRQKLPFSTAQLGELFSAGRLTLKGKVADYQLEADLDLEPELLPAVRAELTAKGTPQRLLLNNLMLESMMGHLETSGEIAWQPQVTTDLALEIRDFDPAYFAAAWPGKLTGSVHLSTHGGESGTSADIEVSALDGQLRGYAISGQGAVKIADNAVQSPGFVLHAGDNHLRIKGRYDANRIETLEAEWQLSLNEPELVLPGLSGTLRSSGSARGNVEALQLNAEVEADALGYEDYSVAALKLSFSSPKLARNTSASYNISLSSSGIEAGPLSQTRLNADLKGSIGDHSFNLALVLPRHVEGAQQDIDAARQLALTLSGKGSWQQAGWQGDLQNAALSAGEFGDWRLLRPAKVSLSADAYALTQSCWGHQQASLCAELDYGSAGHISGEFRLADFSYALLQSWLPPDVNISGSLDAHATLGGSVGAPQLDVSLVSTPGVLRYKSLQDKIERFDFVDLRTTARLVNNHWSAQAGVRLPAQGFANAKLELAGNNADAPLQGELEINFDSLEWLDVFFPEISEFNGQARINFDLAGTLSHPEFMGSASLTNLGAQLTTLGVQLRGGEIQLEANGRNQWQVRGGLMSGEGRLNLNGDLSVPGLDDWRAALTLSGNDFELLNLPNYRLKASPDMQLDLGAEQISLRGTLAIPEANLTISEVPEQAVSVSEDEVIIGEEEREPESGPRLSANILLNLGDKVAFSGFGLSGRLTGQLRIRETPDEPTHGEGVINVVEGRYKAYGQNLNIEQGRLIFQGPLDNPALDVRAVREAGNVVAGIQIGGTAKKLKSEVFSEPPLPPSEAVAILLTGKSLSSASESDANLLANAVTSLGVSQSKFITQKLQQSFGLDVFTIGSNSGVDSSALILGKYLSPDLFISYTKDLFTPASGIKLDYQLTKRLSLEAVSGDQQSMDLKYSVER